MDSIKAFNFFKTIKGSAAVTVGYYTNPTGTKTVNKHKQLEKYALMQVGYGHNYEAKVNRQLDKMYMKQAKDFLIEQGNAEPNLVDIQKKFDELKAEKFKASQLNWAMRVPNTKLIINKKIVNPNYKALQIEAEKNGTLDSFIDELKKQCLALPIATIAENAQIQLFKSAKAKNLETRYYETFEAGKRTEIKYEDIKVGIHVTETFFKEKTTSGRGSLDKENDFKIFSPYLRNLTQFNFAKETEILQPYLLR
jgi:hypothetical protein